jgi:hypothetical protein
MVVRSVWEPVELGSSQPPSEDVDPVASVVVAMPEV